MAFLYISRKAFVIFLHFIINNEKAPDFFVFEKNTSDVF